ncbi:hypothetical protein TNCV_1059201 [Trichonephila clavipes]|nr:hypothetical protein TNCV_1059201 [Trichonephila clavipes]
MIIETTGIDPLFTGITSTSFPRVKRNSLSNTKQCHQLTPIPFKRIEMMETSPQVSRYALQAIQIATPERNDLLNVKKAGIRKLYVFQCIRMTQKGNLGPVVEPYLQSLPNVLFQKHNSRPYSAGHVLTFVDTQSIQLLPCFMWSPDASPIEII